MIFLHDGDMAIITKYGVTVTDFDGKVLDRKPQHINWDPIMAEKGGFKHFMLKRYMSSRAPSRYDHWRVSLDTGKVFSKRWTITTEQFKNARKIMWPHAEQVGTQAWPRST